jgi:hypothetical protein
MSINKASFFAIGLSAGVFENKEEKQTIEYSNLIVLADKENQTIEKDNISVGQEIAKMQLSTDNDNKIALDLANSGLLPGFINFHIKTSIKSGSMVVKIVGFDDKKAA